MPLPQIEALKAKAVESFLEAASKKHNVPVNDIVTGILDKDQLHIWKCVGAYDLRLEILEVIDLSAI